MFIVMKLQEFELEPAPNSLISPLPIVVDAGKMVGYLPVCGSMDEALEDYPEAKVLAIREGMLKEQVARKLSAMDNFPFDDLKEHATGFNEGNPTQAHYLRRAQEVINLFKAEVDKLTVIDNVEMDKAIHNTYADFPTDYRIRNA